MIFSLFAVPFPAIDPVLIHAGPIAIRWYSLAYIGGVILGWWYFSYLNKKRPEVIGKKAFDDIVVWVILGIILGGRFGYVLFYNASYFLRHPLEIFYVWQGGMSFHGGMIGLILAMYLFARKFNAPFLRLTDLIACVVPIGLCFGRLANFINAELYGRVTDVSWGMVFPNGGPNPRHPSQIYEALSEGVLLFLILSYMVNFTNARLRPGMLSGLFLSLYGSFRFVIEFYREPDIQLGFLIGQTTMGQLLCLPMIALGLYLVYRSLKNPPMVVP